MTKTPTKTKQTSTQQPVIFIWDFSDGVSVEAESYKEAVEKHNAKVSKKNK